MNTELYHEEGSLRLTMIDVRRLLPHHNVKDFNDLRSRGLLNLIEKLFNKYLDLGGEYGIEQGQMANGVQLPPSLFSLTSFKVLEQVTNTVTADTRSMLNQE